MKTKALLTILAGSIAPLVHAGLFTSQQTGNWSDPASWDQPPAFPDLYNTIDSAAVTGGYTITYDNYLGSGNGSSSAPGSVFSGHSGGLWVAGGDAITIDSGSTLIQDLTLNTEIRIGEGDAGPGLGTMSIDTGGTFDSGGALGVTIGSSYTADTGGVGAGNGQVDVINGTFRMGSGAAAGGLGVGLNGSTGVLNLGNTLGVAGAATLDLATNNIQMGVGSQFAFGAVGGTGTVTVNSDGQILLGSADITVANGGGNGTLDVTGSITSASTGRIIVGTDETSVGTLGLHNGGVISVGGEVRIGSNGGSGTLNMDGGTLTTTNEFNAGRGVGATLVGASATLTVTGGSISANRVSIGRDGGSASLSYSSGGTFHSNGQFYIGENGDGTATVSAGLLQAGGQFVVGAGNTGVGSLTITGGTITVGQQFDIGQNSANADILVNHTGNRVDVSNATVTTVSQTRIGEGNSGAVGTGQLFIHAGTVWTSGDEFQVGNDGGTGYVNMDGGQLNINQWGAIGRNGGTGVMDFSGGNILMGGGNQTFDIGTFGGAGVATAYGTFNQSGGTLTNTTNTTNVGRDNSGVGVWNMTGGNANMHDLVVGNGGIGTMNMSGTAAITTNNGWLYIGNGNGATVGDTNVVANGVMNVHAGAAVDNSAGWLVMANQAGALGTLNMDGGTFNTGRMQIATQGNGSAPSSSTINISGGTFTNGGWTEIGGGNANNTGILNISNSGVVSIGNAGQDINIGINGGNGELHVSNGGTMNANWWINLGRTGGASGIATVDGTGSLIHQNTGRINVGGDSSSGEHGTASLTISNGGQILRDNTDVLVVGINATSSGVLTVTGTNSLLQNNAGEMFVGWNGGNGVMNIGQNGTVNDNNQLNVGRSEQATGASGTLTVGTFGGAGGTLNVTNQIRIGAGYEGNAGLGYFNMHAGSVTSGNEFIVGEGGTASDNGTQGFAVQDGGTVTSTGEFQIGNDYGTGDYVLHGGTIIPLSYVAIGRTGGTGTMEMDGGLIHKPTNNGDFSVGSWNGNGGVQPAHGTFTQTGGDILLEGSNPSTTFVSRDAGDTGLWTMSGGTFNGWDIVVGNGGTGTYNVSGTAAVQTNGGWMYIGQGDGATGYLNQSGGTINNTSGWFAVASNADRATGVVNQTGGVHTMNRLMMASNGGVNRTATVTISGGSFANNGWTEIGGGNATNQAFFNVTGSGVATFTNGQDMNIGINSGIGTVNVTAGGQMSQDWWVNLGRGGNGSGTMLVDGAGTVFNQTNGRLNVGGDPNVGDGSAGGQGRGSLTISNGAVYNHAGDETNVGVNRLTDNSLISSGTMLVASGATYNGTSGNPTRVGRNNGTGVLTIQDAGTLYTENGELLVGIDGVNSLGTVNIGAGATVNLNQWLNVGRNGGTGFVNQTGGDFNVQQEARIGAWFNGDGIGHGVGTYTMSGGTLTVGSNLQVGEGFSTIDNLASIGTFFLSNGDVHVLNGEFQVGNDGGNGTFNMSGGTLEADSYFGIGRTGGTGLFNLSGGTITKNASGNTGTFDISTYNNGAAGGTFGTLVQTGGAIVNLVTDTNIARDSGDNGIWTMTAGTANLRNLNIGNGGSGVLNLSGTAQITATNGTVIANQGGSAGVANLNGGTLTTQFVAVGGGGAAATFLKFNGTTLQAVSNEGDFLRGFDSTNSVVNAGGAIFDTNGFAVTVNNQFFGTGGLTKNGNGNLSVTNSANDYQGTTVNRGNVIFSTITAAGTNPSLVDITINAPGAASLDTGASAGDLQPLLAKTVTISNGAIALHGAVTSSTDLDFTSYPSLSLGAVTNAFPEFATFSNNLIPGGGAYRLGGGGGNLLVTTLLADVGGSTNLIINDNGLSGNVGLSNQNTYSGSTTINSGTLLLVGGPNVLPSATPVTINSGGTLDLNGVIQQIGSLTGAGTAQLTNSGSATVFTIGAGDQTGIFGGTIDNSNGAISITKIGTGVQTFTAAQTYSALNVTAGSVVLGASNTFTSPTNALSVANGALLKLTEHAGGAGNVKVIDTTTLAIDSTLGHTGQLDITNNALIVRNGTLAAVTAQLKSGQNIDNGYWDGPGIISSTAANDAGQHTTVGVVDNAEIGYTDFAGVSGLVGTEILVKYTWYGDADLSGDVTVDDFAQFQAGRRGEGSGWLYGDFDYSGDVTVDDFALFQDGRRNQTGVLKPADAAILDQEIAEMAAQFGLPADGGSGSLAPAGAPVANGQAVVPEPGSIGLLAIGAFGLMARRRRAASPIQK